MSRRLPVLAALVAVLALLMSAVSSGATAVDAPGTGSMSPGFTHDLATLAPTTQYGAFVTVQDGLDAASVVADHASDVQVLRNYPVISTAFVSGPIASIANLASLPSVVHLQDNTKLQYFGDTAPWATRVGVVREAVAGGPYTDGVGGPILDGDGVGVAIIDSGAFAAHPDLSDPIERNYKFVCTTPGLIYVPSQTCYGNAQIDLINGDPIPTFGFVDVGDTNSDASSGHGTHVAGILAGNGTASTGDYPAGTGPNTKSTFTGVAPGASVTMYSVGEVISVLYAVEALQHIYNNGNTFSPRISVVSNSWGDPGGTPFNATHPVNIWVDKLVDDKDVTVLFAAGNSGGNGTNDATSNFCKNPKAGVICVANYDDDAVSGGRDGGLNPSSSRGKSSDTSTHPDISAPGTWITSTCLAQPICTGLLPETRWAPWYNYISGTSMSTPHVAGGVALMIQADGTLTPAEIENLIQDNAYRFTFGGAYVDDPQNPDEDPLDPTDDPQTSYDKGAGLLDMKATLNAMGTSHGTATAPSNLVVFSGDINDYSGPGAADLESLKVTQQNGSSGQPGFKYDLTVLNGTDVGPGGTVSYGIFQNVNGATYRTNITATAASVTAGGAASAPLVTAAPQDLTRVGNTVSFFVPFSTFGNPTVGEPFHGVWAGSYLTVIQDAGPGGLSESTLVKPQYGKPFARG